MAAHWQDGVDQDAHAPPFDYNPSAWRQRVPIALLAWVGVLISTYLAFYQWGLVDSVWDPIFGDGSEKVLDSQVARRLDARIHMPDGALGAWGYLSEAVLSLVGGTRRWQHRPWLTILFGIDVIPLGIVSAILVVAQGLLVGHWCTLCLVSAGISFSLVFLAYDEVWASLAYLWRVWKRHRDKMLVMRALWGFADERADRLALVPTTRAGLRLQEVAA